MIEKRDLQTTEEMGRWYDAKYTEMGGVWQTPVAEWEAHLDRAGVVSGQQVMDIGCGDGSFLLVAKKRGCEVGGLDISDVAIKWAQAKGLWIARLSIEHEAGEGYCDWAFALGSLEHVIDLPQALDNIHRMLKADGHFYCYVPNELWQHWDQPNERTGTDDEWARLFELHNLHTEHVWRNGDCTAFWGVRV